MCSIKFVANIRHKRSIDLMWGLGLLKLLCASEEIHFLQHPLGKFWISVIIWKTARLTETHQFQMCSATWIYCKKTSCVQKWYKWKAQNTVILIPLKKIALVRNEADVCVMLKMLRSYHKNIRNSERIKNKYIQHHLFNMRVHLSYMKTHFCSVRFFPKNVTHQNSEGKEKFPFLIISYLETVLEYIYTIWEDPSSCPVWWILHLQHY